MDDSALNLDAYFAPSDPDTWRQHVEATLKGRPFEKLIRPTPDGFGIEPLYTAPPEGYTPGEANHPPFIRGARTADRRRAGWDIRALHDMGDPTTTAQAIADDLERGVHSLWLVPAHHDRPGLALFTAAGLNEALSAVEATRVAIYLDPGPHGGAWFATLLAMAHMRGLDPSNLQGAILYDPLGTLAHTGHLPQGFDAAWHALAVLTAQATTHAPALRTVGLSGLPYHHAGASAAQELAAVMATAIATFRHLEAHNIAPETVAAQSVLQFAVGSHMFMDIAKLRAARLLWSRILTACGVKPNAPELHVCTSPADLTR
ncbi:MAG: methylmalonyl-CoA mutase family protein, partial [Myxococcota bacterium]